LISSSVIVWVTNGSRSISPFMASSTIPGAECGLYSAKRGTFPYAPGDQLERTGGNLLSGPCDTNDNGLPPPTVSTFQRCTHDVNVTDTFKGMVNTPLVDIQQNIFNRFVIIIRVNAVSGPELTGQVKFCRISIDSDNTSRFCLTGPCTAARPIAPRPKMATESPGCTLAVLWTAPIPVVTPQPNRQTCSWFAS
jgi:hypothetical protein